MIDPTILIGEPLNFKGKLKIYPPRVRDVVTNPNYGILYKILTMSQDDIKDEVGKKLKNGEKIPTPYEYLILSCQYIDNFSIMVRNAF